MEHIRNHVQGEELDRRIQFEEEETMPFITTHGKYDSHSLYIFQLVLNYEL